MIIKGLMELLKSLILLVLNLFPVLPDLSFIAGYISDFLGLVRSVNMFISVPVVGLCLLTILICYHVRAIWSIIMWVVRKIPGVS